LSARTTTVLRAISARRFHCGHHPGRLRPLDSYRIPAAARIQVRQFQDSRTPSG